MPFYEIVYETGNNSVAFYEGDDEAKRGIGEQHRRALNGESAGPLGGPAERVAKVFVYSNHPNEFNPNQTASSDVVEKEVASLVKAMKDDNGVISIDQLSLAVRDLSHPMETGRESRLDSMYKMKEDRALSLGFLEEVK